MYASPSWLSQCILKFPLELLSESDLVEVLEETFEICHRWYDIGLKLGLTPAVLNAILVKNYLPHDCLRDVLRHWLQQKVG